MCVVEGWSAVWRSRGWSGLAMMETEGGKVWVAASCTVVCRAAAVGIG